MLAVEFADLVCRVLPLKIELSDLAIGDSFQTKNPNQDQMALWNTGFSAKGLSAEEFAHPDEFALGRCRSVQALQVPVGEEHEESNGAGDERLRSLFNWGIPLLLHVPGYHFRKEHALVAPGDEVLEGLSENLFDGRLYPVE